MRWHVRALGTSLVTLASVALIATSSAAGAALPSRNLVRNAGAEDSPGATGTEAMPPAVWVATGPLMSAVKYGASGGFPEAGNLPEGGVNFFAGGPGFPSADIEQEVDVSAWANQIDALGVTASYSAFLGGFATQNDFAVLSVDVVPGNFSMDPVIGPGPAERGNLTRFLFGRGSEVLQPGTRRLRVNGVAIRQHGDYNDGYIDNIVVRLVANPATRVPKVGFERDCDVNQLFGSFLTTQAVRSVTFTVGRRSVTDTRKPFFARFRGIADTTTGTVRAKALRPNGTVLVNRSQAVPTCDPAIE